MEESELIPRSRCEELMLAVQAAAYRHGVTDLEVLLSASSESLTRFANNAIGQNVSERSLTLSVRTQIDQRTARAVTNRIHRDGIHDVVDEAVALTKASAPIDDLLPMFAKAEQSDSSRWSEAAATCSPAGRAAGVAEAIRIVEAEGQNCAGIYATADSAEVLMNSRGIFCYYFDTLTTFSITAMTEDSSGWAKATSAVHEEVSPAALARRAVKKAKKSRSPREIGAGLYTVVLEPAAVLDLVGQIFADFSATSLDDKRSFLNDRKEERLFGENITIYDDVDFPLQTGARFDGEGVKRKPLTLVKNGTPREIAYCRRAAAKAGTDPTGHGFVLPNEAGEMPVNIVIAGGSTSIDDLIRSTPRGILVTRLWYIREVEPYDKVMTGMTRDGTFLIHDGEIAGGLHNFRFNQSVVEMLRNVADMSSSVRASGEEAFDMVVPAMKVNDFRFTEVTKF